MTLGFTGERIVPGAPDCEPTFAQKMYQEHIARYFFASQFVAGMDVVDVGCGVGYGAQALAKAGAKSVLALDLSTDAVEHGRKNFFHPNLSLEVGDAEKFTVEEKVDVATCFELIEHVNNPSAVLDRIVAALKPGGLLILSTPRPLEEIRTHFHVHEMNLEELKSKLSDRFKNVEVGFQSNHFTSIVCRDEIKSLDQIIPVTDKTDLDNADYFVMLASDSPLPDHKAGSSVVALNDDTYVKTLEGDIVNLRNGENFHLGVISSLEAEREELRSSLEALTQDKLAAETRLSALATPVDALAQRLGAFDRSLNEMAAEILRETRESQSTQLQSFERLTETVRAHLDRRADEREIAIEAARREAEERVEQLSSLNEQLSSDNHKIRHMLAHTAQKLAEAETDLNARSNAVVELDEVRSQNGALTNELTAMRHRYEETERTLARFRGSVSWYITRPVRWTGRTFKKLSGKKAN